MTPKEKIVALVEHIKKEFPKGCEGMQCRDCPLDGHKREHGTVENSVCCLLDTVSAYNHYYSSINR